QNSYKLSGLPSACSRQDRTKYWVSCSRFFSWLVRRSGCSLRPVAHIGRVVAGKFLATGGMGFGDSFPFIFRTRRFAGEVPSGLRPLPFLLRLAARKLV